MDIEYKLLLKGYVKSNKNIQQVNGHWIKIASTRESQKC